MERFFFALAVSFVTVFSVQAQTAPDSPPVMQSSATYAMPQSVIDAEIDGKVVVALRVDENGETKRATLISGPTWPCSKIPSRALDELSSSLSDTMMKLRFSPAIKNGKPIAKDIGLTFELKNPKLLSKSPEIDPVTGKPKVRQIVGGVVNGKAKRLAKPSYPQEAKANRDSGTVSVRVLIDEKGKVIRAGALDGPQTLQYASREAACSSAFTPTLLAGNPVKVSGVITYNFVP